MPHDRHSTNWPIAAASIRRSGAALAAMAAITIHSGCQSAHYRAAKLPVHMQVPPKERTSDLNLTRLSGHGVGTSKIGPGDLLELTISSGRGDEKVEPTPIRVAHDGRVAVPLVGWVPVAGLEPVEAEQRVAATAVERNIYRQPSVTLQVADQAVNRITVLGAVAEPGVYPLPRGSSDLANAIAAAGGMTKEAGSKVDVLRHDVPSFFANDSEMQPDHEGGVVLASYESVDNAKPTDTAPQHDSTAARIGAPSKAPPQAVRLDLAQAEPSRGNNHQLSDRDVVMVLPRDKELIHVTGLVKRADQFELPVDQDMRVLDAIALAGGVSSPVADKVFVIRRTKDSPEPIVIQASIRKAKTDGNENLRLAAGDLVSVETTPATMVVDTANTFFRMTLGLGSSVTIF